MYGPEISGLQGALNGLLGGGMGIGPRLLDMILMVTIGIGIVRGAMVGGVKQAGEVAGIVLGLKFGLEYMDKMGRYIQGHFDIMQELSPYMGFLVVFLLVRVLVYAGSAVVAKGLDLTGAGILDKVVGGAIGAFKSALAASIVLIVVGYIGIPKPSTEARSKWYKPVKSTLPAAWNMARGVFPGIGPPKKAPQNIMKFMRNKFTDDGYGRRYRGFSFYEERESDRKRLEWRFSNETWRRAKEINNI
jgi:membrane protein required for colicin V production